jgi:hypothetical protein
MDVIAPQNVIGSAPMQDAPLSAPPPPDATAPPPQCAAAPQPPSTVVKPPLAPHNVVVDAAMKPQNDGATPRAASTPAPWVDTSNKMQAPSTTRSGARQRKTRRQSFPPSARVTDRARRALDAAWTREVPGLGNPFRTRLTQQVCVQLGIPDYLGVVGEAVDLTLCRERLANGFYKNDAALQSDVRRIHENALKYHGIASPFTVAADQLVRDFAEALSRKEAPRTARRPPKKKLFSPPKEVQLFSPAEAVPGKRRVVFSPVGPEVIKLPPTEPAEWVAPDKYQCDGCGREMGAGLRGFEVYATCGACASDFCFACCDTVEVESGLVMRLAHDALCSSSLRIRDRNVEVAREDALLASL